MHTLLHRAYLTFSACAAFLLFASPVLAQTPDSFFARPSTLTLSVQGLIQRLNDLLGDTVNLMAEILFADFGTGVPLDCRGACLRRHLLQFFLQVAVAPGHLAFHPGASRSL